MLVASAAIGLIAPIGVQANDINIEGMNSYSSSKSSSKKQQFNSKTFANELATVNEKIDGLETQLNEFEAGSFSDTTTFDGKVNFTVGALSYDGTVQLQQILVLRKLLATPTLRLEFLQTNQRQVGLLK